jgi:hypothetical protein
MRLWNIGTGPAIVEQVVLERVEGENCLGDLPGGFRPIGTGQAADMEISSPRWPTTLGDGTLRIRYTHRAAAGTKPAPKPRSEIRRSPASPTPALGCERRLAGKNGLKSAAACPLFPVRLASTHPSSDGGTCSALIALATRPQASLAAAADAFHRTPQVRATSSPRTMSRHRTLVCAARHRQGRDRVGATKRRRRARLGRIPRSIKSFGHFDGRAIRSGSFLEYRIVVWKSLSNPVSSVEQCG